MCDKVHKVLGKDPILVPILVLMPEKNGTLNEPALLPCRLHEWTHMGDCIAFMDD